jgi:hypothetical protein
VIVPTTTKTITEHTTNLPAQYLQAFEFDFESSSSTNESVTVLDGNDTEFLTNDDMVLEIQNNFNLRDNLIEKLQALTVFKTSTSVMGLKDIGNRLFTIFTTSGTTTLKPKKKHNELNRHKNNSGLILTDFKPGCFHNETRILVSYSDLDKILCRNESSFHRMNCIDKKLKKKVQDKVQNLYRIQMVSNYFMPFTLNCSSLSNSLKNNNSAYSNYTICSFLNVTNENKIKILWKIYLVSEDCYRTNTNVTSNSTFFRNISMRIQVYDTGNFIFIILLS